MKRWALGQRMGAKLHYVMRDDDDEQVAICGARFIQSDYVLLLDSNSVEHFACPRCVAKMKNEPVFFNSMNHKSYDKAGRERPMTLAQAQALKLKAPEITYS